MAVEGGMDCLVNIGMALKTAIDKEILLCNFFACYLWFTHIPADTAEGCVNLKGEEV